MVKRKRWPSVSSTPVAVPRPRQPTKHNRRYTPKQVRNLVEGAGFRIERLTFVHAAIFPAILAVRLGQRWASGRVGGCSRRVRHCGSAGADQCPAERCCSTRGCSAARDEHADRQLAHVSRRQRPWLTCAHTDGRLAALDGGPARSARREAGSLRSPETGVAARVRADWGALALAMFAGASAWISLGTLALLNDRQARLGVLPPIWSLIVLIVIGAGVAWLVRLRTSESWPLSLTAAVLGSLAASQSPSVAADLERPVGMANLVGRDLRGRAGSRDPRRGKSSTGEADSKPGWRSEVRLASSPRRMVSHPTRAPWIAAGVFLLLSLAAGATASARDSRRR